MMFNHDPDKNFYYLGNDTPRPGFLRDKLLEKSHAFISVDTETISLKEKIAIGVGICVSENEAFYFPLWPTASSLAGDVINILKDESVIKVYHNSMFDLIALREYDVDYTNVRDTNDMAHLLCYQYSGLGDLYPVHEVPVQEIKQVLLDNNAKTMLDVPTDTTAYKCCQDCIATYRVYQSFIGRIDLPYLLSEMATIPIMLKMSYRGLKIDHDMLELVMDYLQSNVDRYETMCEELEGFKPSSPDQLSYVLAKRGAYSVFTKLPFTKGGKTGRKRLASGKEILQRMDDPLAYLALDYKSKASLLHNYIEPWSHDERAYTRFHLDAITGRPSSTERNMQNIPGKPNDPNPRNIFLPDSVIWTDFDFSQLELRVLAKMSGDREMQYIFSLPKLNPDGSKNEEADIHQQTANFLGIPRKISKNVNFAMVYGGSDQTLMETAEIRDIRKASSLRRMWFNKFPQAGDWIQATQSLCFDDPYAYTLLGRKIRLPTLEEDSVDGIQRKSINYRIQGTAAEIFKRGLVKCANLDLALQVHDEMLADGYVEEKWLKDQLEYIAGFYTPIEVKYLTRWE